MKQILSELSQEEMRSGYDYFSFFIYKKLPLEAGTYWHLSQQLTKGIWNATADMQGSESKSIDVTTGTLRPRDTYLCHPEIQWWSFDNN